MRKLEKACYRVARTVYAVTQLRKDRHPGTGTMLTVRARRMLKADVGGGLELLVPFLHAEGAGCLGEADNVGNLMLVIVADAFDCPTHPFTEE